MAMLMRSWLYIKGNNPAQLRKAPLVGADALVVDLSNVPANDAAAQIREDVSAWFTA